MLAQSGPFPREDAGGFGSFAAVRQSSPFRTSGSFDEFFDRWFHSLDDLFFGSEWPRVTGLR
jgi:hypothetical protein